MVEWHLLFRGSGRGSGVLFWGRGMSWMGAAAMIRLELIETVKLMLSVFEPW